MAGQTNRTITLTLNAQTNGADGVRALASEIQKLGKKGGEAAPEFDRLSSELQELANRQDAVSTFTELTAAVGASRAALDAAKTSVNAEVSALATLRQTLVQAREAEAQHAASVREAASARNAAKVSLDQARASVSSYVASIGGAKSADAAQKVELKALAQAVRDAKAAYDAAKVSVGALAPEMDKLKAAAAAAANDFKKQEAALNGASAVADKASNEYDTLTEALNQASSAADKLGLDTKDLTAEQNRLTQSMAKLETEAQQLKAALAGPGRAALTAAEQVQQAFGVVGVRSAAAVKAEILKVNSALHVLARDTNVTGVEFDRAFASGKARIAELERELRKAEAATTGLGSGFVNAFKQFGPATLVFNGVTAAINGIFTAGQKIPQITAEFQTLERTLRILTGSTAAAQRELGYIAGVASRVGVDIKGMADSYIKLTAATKSTNLEGAQTRRIFEAVSGAMGVLGASSAEATNAMQAVTQIVSKGTVSMEEFRQQLAERLPGAFQVTAEQLNITTADLNELISSGKLTADDVLPALAAGLEKVYKTSEKNTTLRGQWAEFVNAVKLSANAIGDSGLVQALLDFARVGTAAITGVAEAFVLGALTIEAAIKGIANGNLSDEMAKLGDRAQGLRDRLAGVAGIGNTSAKSISELATEAKAAGQDFFTMADGTRVATDAVLNASNEFVAFTLKSARALESAENFATSARKAAEYTRSAGEASITAANAIGSEADQRKVATEVATANAAALGNLVEAERKVLAVMEKDAMQRAEALRDGKASSDAHKKQLNDLGEEIGKRRVVVQGLEQQAEANRLLAVAQGISAEANLDNANRVDALRQTYTGLQQVLTFVRGEVDAGRVSQEQLKVVEEESRKTKALYTDALKDEAFATEAVAKLSGNEKAARDAAILSTERQLQFLRDVGEARTSEYAKLQAQLTQLQTERQALDDNSSALYRLQAAYNETKAKVEELRAAKAAGKEVTVALAAAETEAAKAVALYKDALRDQQAAITANLASKNAKLEVERQEINLAIAQQRTIYEVAKATGQEASAAAALVRIKQLEIQLAEINAKAKRAEANATLQRVAAAMQELQASGTLTEAKKAELEAQRLGAEAKKIEADIAEETANQLRQLADATAESGNAANGAAGGYDRLSGSLQQVGNAAADAAEKVDALNDSTSRTVTAGAGGARGAGVDVNFTENLYRKGATIEEAKLAEKYVGELYARQAATKLTGNLGNGENAARLQKLAIDTAVNQALAAARKEIATGQQVDLGPAVGDRIAQQIGRSPLRSGGDVIDRVKRAGNAAVNTMTVKIDLGGGRTKDVNVASRSDAEALAGVFKILEESAGTTY